MKFGIFEVVEHQEEVINKLKDEFNSIPENVEFVENLNEADYIISLGGDGTLLDCFQKFPNKIVLPVRDYKLCNLHQNFNNYCFFENVDEYDVLELTCREKENRNLIANSLGISEIVIRNKNVSKALRCTLEINNKVYASNIIGDGIIIATPLGSTGYFQNITNTIFTNGIGIGFLNNAQRMSNLVLNNHQIINVYIERGNCQVAIDHNLFDINEGDYLTIQTYLKPFKMINYKINFMCYNCRNERHSAYVNTIYKVI